MKKHVFAILGAGALLLTMATSAFAAEPPSYGKVVQDAFGGAQFGKIVQYAREIGHIENAAGGARGFVEIHLP